MSPTSISFAGAHGHDLTLVQSKYYKGFLLNSVSCKFLAMDNIPEVAPHKKRRKLTLTCALSVKVINQVWKSKRIF